MGGGKQRSHVSALGNSEERRLLRSDGIEYGLDVLGPLFERRKADVSVGHSRTAFVEKDQAGKAAEPGEKSSVFGTFPGVLDIAEPALRVEQIRWAVADHLIGDGDVAASCIARLGSLHDRLTNRLGNCETSPGQMGSSPPNVAN